jgi:hypothetical protein
MALPLINNITLYRGDDFSYPVTIQVGGVALNLTGATILSQIKVTTEDATPAVSFTVGSIVAASGQFTLSLTGTQTAALTALLSGGVYDVQITLGGVNTTYLAGSVTLTKDVTR